MSNISASKKTIEESRVLQAFESGDFQPVRPRRLRVRQLKQAARATLKDRRLNIRLSAPVLAGLRARAAEEGLPYQTLIASVLHKFVTGRLVDRSSKMSRSASGRR
jgi:predicted DNA binding CopG/RHH family protein